MSGIALISYLLLKNTSKHPRLNYYQAHIGFFDGDGYDVFMQNFGLERVYSHWFFDASRRKFIRV